FEFGAHVSDFFGTLIDEEDEKLTLRVISQDTAGYLLQQNRLPRSGWCDNEAALAFADRGDQVEDSHRDVVLAGFQDETFAGVNRGQILEADTRSLCTAVPVVREENQVGVDGLAVISFSHVRSPWK